jgi:hypothetical protein
LSLISSLSILIPLLIGLVYFKKLDQLQKWFWVFIVVSALFDILASYTARHGIPNVWVFKIFLVVDLAFFMWFFSRITTFPVWKWVLAAIVFCLIILSQLYTGNNSVFNVKDSVFFVSTFLFFIIQSSFMIIVTFDDFTTDIRKNYVFWIAFARLFYFLIIVFIYIYPNFIADGYRNKFLDRTNTTINMLANVLLNMIYGISFLCHNKKT